MARPTVVAWAACGVLAFSGSLTVGGLAAAKARPGNDLPTPTARALVRSQPANARGEQTALPPPANAATAGGGSADPGGSITRADLDTFVSAHTAALKGKSRAAFLAAVDPKHTDLVTHQGQLFDNL